ncbi:hypothetical protein APHAL10511_006969 [Amanita phalloides]|nr:hypothetical protein APHAL10511_006969 [Amanita phalloides]
MLSTFLFLALLNAFICHASSDALNFVADCSVTTPFRITPQICWDHNFVEHIRNQPYLNNCNGAHLTSRFVNSGPTRIRNVVVTASNAATGLVTVTYEYQIKSTGKWVACPVKTLWNDVPDIDQHPSHMFQNLPANFATYNALLTDIQSACKDVVNVVRRVQLVAKELIQAVDDDSDTSGSDMDMDSEPAGSSSIPRLVPKYRFDFSLVKSL